MILACLLCLSIPMRHWTVLDNTTVNQGVYMTRPWQRHGKRVGDVQFAKEHDERSWQWYGNAMETHGNAKVSHGNPMGYHVGPWQCLGVSCGRSHANTTARNERSLECHAMPQEAIQFSLGSMAMPWCTMSMTRQYAMLYQTKYILVQNVWLVHSVSRGRFHDLSISLAMACLC